MFDKFLSTTGKLSSRLKPAFIAMFPWLITGIAMVGVIVIMTPRSEVVEIGDEAWLNGSAGGVSEQPHLLIEPPAQDSRSEGRRKSQPGHRASAAAGRFRFCPEH